MPPNHQHFSSDVDLIVFLKIRRDNFLHFCVITNFVIIINLSYVFIFTFICLIFHTLRLDCINAIIFGNPGNHTCFFFSFLSELIYYYVFFFLRITLFALFSSIIMPKTNAERQIEYREKLREKHSAKDLQMKEPDT